MPRVCSPSEYTTASATSRRVFVCSEGCNVVSEALPPPQKKRQILSTKIWEPYHTLTPIDSCLNIILAEKCSCSIPFWGTDGREAKLRAGCLTERGPARGGPGTWDSVCTL